MQARPAPNLKILWFALFNSILIYLGVAWFAIPPDNLVDVETAILNPTVRLLYGLAIVAFVMSSIVFNVMASAVRQVEPMRNDQPRAASPALLRAFIVRWALLEAVTIFGLVAAFLGHSREAFIPAFILSAIGFLLAFPSDQRIARLQA